MIRKALITVVLWAGVCLVPLAAGDAAAAPPTIVDLGTGLTARAINDRGVVVGDAYRTASDGFFKWRDGRLTVFGQLGVSADRAVAVNRSGTMAVWTSFDTSFRYQDGHVRDLGSLVDPANETLASDINDAGVIVGASVAPDFNFHAFWWTRGTMTDLGTLGGSYSAATAINGNGQILGVSYTASGESHVVIWHNGGITDLGTLAAGGATGTDINDKGQIVGSVTTAAGRTRAFVWSSGVLTKLPPLPGGDFSAATAINERGDVVGESSTASGDRHAVVWSGGSVRDLGTLGGSSSSAVGINENGLIAGNAQDANGTDHAVVWTR